MLTDIVNDNQREVFLDELQDIITRIQFANDECDYGMGLELGLDLFSFGNEMFNRKATMLLTLAYELLGKSAFGKVVERHLEQRDKNTLYINLTESEWTLAEPYTSGCSRRFRNLSVIIASILCYPVVHAVVMYIWIKRFRNIAILF